MMKQMKKKLTGTLLALGCVLMQPALVLAQADLYDVRLEGYNGGSAELPAGSPWLTWVVLGALVAACVGVMFVNLRPKTKAE